MTPITRDEENLARSEFYESARQQVMADLAREPGVELNLPPDLHLSARQLEVVQAKHAESIASLQAKLEQSKKDAARYRFLRDVPYTPELHQAMACQANGKFDELIDAAMNKEPGHEA